MMDDESGSNEDIREVSVAGSGGVTVQPPPLPAPAATRTSASASHLSGNLLPKMEGDGHSTVFRGDDAELSPEQQLNKLQIIKAKTMYEMVEELDGDRKILFLTDAQVTGSPPKLLSSCALVHISPSPAHRIVCKIYLACSSMLGPLSNYLPIYCTGRAFGRQ